MIITDDFVFLHRPKTGGTFVTRVLKRVYGSSAIDIAQHGGLDDIPDEHRGKPLVATFRHPLARIVSHYEFGHWKRRPEHNFSGFGSHELTQLYPRLPDLSFVEYLEPWNERWLPRAVARLGITRLDHLGEETYDHITFFSRDPDATLLSVSADPSVALSPAHRPELANVRFLRTDRMNRDLHTFLAGIGWSSESIDFILEAAIVVPEDPGRTIERPWRDYYTESMRRTMMRKERLLVDANDQLGDDRLVASAARP